MITPLSWLKEYVDIDVTPQELQDKLFSCGFEVEELYGVGKDISKVVVGYVLECEAIPGTHLHVCKVDCGEHGTFQICCGADNVHAGGKFQEGGAMPPQDPAAAQGGGDPMQEILMGCQQAVETQDCQIALQVCQVMLEMAGGGAAPAEAAPAPAPAEAQGEPVYRTGGRLVRRIK